MSNSGDVGPCCRDYTFLALRSQNLLDPTMRTYRTPGSRDEVLVMPQAGV